MPYYDMEPPSGSRDMDGVRSGRDALKPAEFSSAHSREEQAPGAQPLRAPRSPPTPRSGGRSNRAHTARTEWANGQEILTRIVLLYVCAKRGGAGSLKAGWVHESVNRTGLHEL